MKNHEDISYKKTENNIENYRSRFSPIIELFPAGFFVLNQEGVIVDINKLGLSLIGLEKEEILERNFTDFIDEIDRGYFLNTLQGVINSSEPKTIEIRIKGINTNYFYSFAVLRFISFPDLQGKFCFLSLTDFTSWKMKEEVIKDSEARFENIANTAPVMIWIADVEGLFSFVNKVWLDYSDKPVGEHLGMYWLKNVHQDDLENLLNTFR